ncbi:hypothetical protein EVAR_32896_1 [Eumeta japonica]|uniref:Uncharacterized protein n=1 Tax=Eumeta variegata TaxID=151549 RepID=A0A4C1VTC9_EUMVA|nr:hypothetical protein EVAR_32896_1 [Eumeta japonica]
MTENGLRIYCEYGNEMESTYRRKKFNLHQYEQSHRDVKPNLFLALLSGGSKQAIAHSLPPPLTHNSRGRRRTGKVSSLQYSRRPSNPGVFDIGIKLRYLPFAIPSLNDLGMKTKKLLIYIERDQRQRNQTAKTAKSNSTRNAFTEQIQRTIIIIKTAAAGAGVSCKRRTLHSEVGYPEVYY